MNTFVVQVSSGTGPEEVRRFVARLAGSLEERCEERGLFVREVITHGDEMAPRSIEIVVEGDAPQLLARELGTHALIEPSESRGRSSRKRWFAGVSVHPIDADSLAPETKKGDIDVNPADLEITASRAGGPGGQHVNKTSSAVRVLHRPTGIGVRVTSERSQRANIKLALRRIAERLKEQLAGRRESDKSARRRSHYRVERGAPVRTYRVDRSGRLEPLPGAPS